MHRLIGGIVVFGAVIGLKFYNKSSASSEVQAHLVKLCSGDAQCEQAVATHFDACFESSYKMGGRRTSSRLEGAELVKCINARSGKPYFSFSEKGE